MCIQVVVLEEHSEKTVQIISPIHPDTHEAEIHNLSSGSYYLYLEIHVSTYNTTVLLIILSICKFPTSFGFFF